MFIFNETELLNEKRLSEEVSLIEQIQKTYGKEVIELLQSFIELDEAGKRKVLDYASDIEALQSLRQEKLL